VDLPPISEFLGYCFYFPTTVIGPPVTYRDFVKYMNNEGQYKHIPGPGKRAGFLFIQVLISAVVVTVFMPIFNFEYVTSTEYANKSFGYRFLYFNITAICLRARYYVAFKLAQIMITMSGLAWQGYDTHGNERWEEYYTIRTRLELTTSVRYKIEYWNSGVQRWLKNYVYFRVIKEGNAESAKANQVKASLITNLTSALWHGFYPGYFMVFIYLTLANEASKRAFRLKGTLGFLDHGPYRIITWYRMRSL
jgi:lysophospholipid acyltransferase